MTAPLLAADMLPDFQTLPAETIELEADQIDRAWQLSRLLPTEAKQWWTYLNSLALFSFEQWLADRAPDLAFDAQQGSILQPKYANVIDAVGHLRVGEFRVCLLVAGSLWDQHLTLLRAVVELPEWLAHFYVVVEVQEELSQAMIRGFLRHDQLVQQLQAQDLPTESDWTYALPQTWLDPDPNRLLLYLRLLTPAALPLPQRPSQAAATQPVDLVALLPSLQSPDTPLWQILSWEQGATLLANPELLDWLYRLQTAPAERAPALVEQLGDLLQLFSQQAVNVGRWLRDELDELAQALPWVLLPPLNPALRTRSFRAPTVEAESILRELERTTDMTIPAQARGAYQDIPFAQVALRLYAITWPLSEAAVPEWTLLLILGSQSGAGLPDGTKLRVSDRTGLLIERTASRDLGPGYLFVRVVGERREKFLATLTLPDGTALTLPPFSCC